MTRSEVVDAAYERASIGLQSLLDGSDEWLDRYGDDAPRVATHIRVIIDSLALHRTRHRA